MPEQLVIDAALVRIDQLLQAGQLEAAERAARELLSQVPDNVNAWMRLGLALSRRKNSPAAEEAFSRAAAMQSTDPRIWNELSIAINRQGRGADAADCARRALALDANSADYWASLGNALAKDWRLSEAAEAFQQSLSLQRSQAAVWNNLGDVQAKQGQHVAALGSIQSAIQLAPGSLEPVANFAFVLCQAGEREEAARFLEQHVVVNPSLPENWVVLGELWQRMIQWPLAEAAFRRALTIAPQHTKAQFQLARVLRDRRQFVAAEQLLQPLLKREPQHADAWALLGQVIAAQGRANESVPYLQRAIDIGPSQEHSARLLMTLQYEEGITGERLLAAHRQWDERFARPLLPSAPPAVNDTAANRRLRIGLVSSDFGQHPTAFLVLPAVELLDRLACALFCYSDRAHEDQYTARFRAAAAAWRVTFGQSDQDVAAQIQRDGIDILIDLMGHTGKRLLMFARRPAPVQVTWFGYVGTTGLSTMDFLIADRFHVREGEEPWYTEQVLRMPNGYACYTPPPNVPNVARLPALATGQVTFGCFNNAAKYSPRMMQAWAEILGRVPTARLFLKTDAFDDTGVEKRWRELFESRGVEAERLLIEGWSDQLELMAAYNRIDLALDTQPYSGGLTTCEALWMGVPVITFPGRTFAGRHTTSHMTTAGLGQFVATDLAGYVELAVSWANRLNELARIRTEMRERVRSSPLCDAPRFAGNLLAVLHSAWQARGSSGAKAR
jgi:protein O-GlcNAc transferase